MIKVYMNHLSKEQKKIIQEDSVSSSISSIYESTYKHLGNIFDIQKEQLQQEHMMLLLKAVDI